MYQNIQQMFPELFYGRDKHPFVRRVYSRQCRSEGNHVQCGIFIEEQATFESCVNCFHFGFYTEQAFVRFGCYFENGRMRIGLPSRITFTESDFRSSQSEHGMTRTAL